MTKIWVIENVLRLEKIAHNASWRNFIFANFAGKSFSTATGDNISMRLLFAKIGVDKRYRDFSTAAHRKSQNYL
jgi:hypothetical protein